MRLWQQALIPYLDNRRLLGQHSECCALRGRGWGKKHATVDYVFKYGLGYLYSYHMQVMEEMFKRGYNVTVCWFNRTYRGKHIQMTTLAEDGTLPDLCELSAIYKEHDDRYLQECLLNLKSKNAELVNGKTVDEWLIELDLKNVG